MRIILVEDETDLGFAIRRTLSQKSYVVDWVKDGDTAWKYLENSWTQYTLGVFDWMLPGLSGLELLKRLRQQNNPLPVLMLTAKDTMDDKVVGLDAGADDYLVKPFGMSELLARLRALQRRSPLLQHQQLQVGNIALDYKTNSVWLTEAGVPQQSISLTAKEFQFLEYFMRHPGQIITSEQLLSQMWSLEAERMSNVVAAQVRLLRRKLTSLGCDRQIETVYGLGYRFKPHYELS
ncbi:MAG: response regulator transcription factor [Xenococcaceae cyanobacterium MO_207.B15]|nr:response regulator transcription factor [Xenococcaceae cyanobacterium MO_207.B15]